MRVKVTMKRPVKKPTRKPAAKKPLVRKARRARKTAKRRKAKLAPQESPKRDPEWREVLRLLPPPAVEVKTVRGIGSGPLCEVLIAKPAVKEFNRIWMRVWIGNETNGRGHVVEQPLPGEVKVGDVYRWAGGVRNISPAKAVEKLNKEEVA